MTEKILTPEENIRILTEMIQLVDNINKNNTQIDEAFVAREVSRIVDGEPILDVEVDDTVMISPGRFLFEVYQNEMGFGEDWNKIPDSCKAAYEKMAEASRDFWEEHNDEYPR